MGTIRNILISGLCLSVCFPSFSHGPELLTPEEIWQEGASWVEVFGNEPSYYYFSVNGRVVHDGKSFMKVSYDYMGHETFWCGINVKGGKVSVLVNDATPSGDTIPGKWISFPYCDFNDIEVGRGFAHLYVAFHTGGEATTDEVSCPVLKSRSVVHCPGLPGRSLEIYSTEEDLYSSWHPYRTTMVVSGLGAVSSLESMIDPFASAVPGGHLALQTLYFKDASGREIFRHPHYERIMGILGGVEGLTDDKEAVVSVYSISGGIVIPEASPELMDRLPHGVYIKRQGDRTEKILVR